ncbi:kinase that interacts with cdc31p [Saccharomyces pastorianus]|uniref:non-specific serine/threonine protein kinase n=1 Tax=Saccharomyces pastorianus TaxID=27292 RepID=A0A6C1EGS0_SACPS|nr:kinase that interacts with cdc31p [Saccharomyces pastorianus]
MMAKPQNGKQGLSEGEMDVSSLFKRTEVVGRGKFGVVYKGYNVKTRRVFAIKVLNLDSDSDEVEDVQREIQFLASLKQIPNITRYYGSYLKDTSLWIIMEYCAGGSLRSLLRPGKIDEKYIGVIMRELLVALKCIHKDNVIHRDIKAANVLITNEGNVKLCDFGVAAQVNQTSLRRQTMAGTPYWMAPEVIMEGVYYDTKVDIWSLGITTYEIATGNPPYCDVEALRAMQLIIKSKPPRLEGRSYSSSLKEFIALCLDEDPKERLSADDLLKSKFIKNHKATPTSILKELVSRYLLFRDKNKSMYRIEGSMPESELLKPTEAQSSSQTSGGNEAQRPAKSSEYELKMANEGDVETKWDFDSLSSSDYIIENNINLDVLAEDTNNEWATAQHDQFNYAYPDEDSYYFDPTNHNTRPLVYQGTTIGKGYSGTIAQNSTLNAPVTTNYTNSKYPSKMVAGTTNTSGTHTNGPMTSSKKLENKAPKQLLELFEDNDIITGENDMNAEAPKMNKSISSLNAGNNSREDFVPSNEVNGNMNSNKIRPHLPPLSNGNNYYSQSTPALPLLQTKFNKTSKGPPTSGLTTAPTSIEIEIPEELPDSALPTPVSADPVLITSTKARSSTMTAGTSPSSTSAQYKPVPSVSRRLTVSTNRPDHSPSMIGGQKLTATASTTAISTLATSSSIYNNSNSADDETSRGSSGSNTANSIQMSISNSSNTTKLLTHKASSPSRPLLGTGTSPNRKPANSPTQNINHNGIHTNLGVPPTMKPMVNSKDSKDILLQPLNSITSSSTINTTNSNGGNSTTSLNHFSNEKENSRVNGDFKRNNPNLKLQMPLPTPVVRNKLLDPNTAAPSNTNGMPGSAGICTNENINQFGFNTSSASNIPVSMTPISEKHIDFGSKIKRSQSISNRKNSSASEQPLNILNSTVPGNPCGTNNNNTGANNNISLAINTGVAGTNTNATAATIPSSTTAATTAPISQQSIQPGTQSNHILNSTTAVANPTNLLGLAMYPPPQSLQMEMFLDLETSLSGKQRRIDRKPQVLKELENLLQMFEEGLPCIEHALKEQLTSTLIKDNDH